MTAPLTTEERAAIRRIATEGHVPAQRSTVLRLLDALDQAEAENATLRVSLESIARDTEDAITAEFADATLAWLGSCPPRVRGCRNCGSANVDVAPSDRHCNDCGHDEKGGAR